MLRAPAQFSICKQFYTVKTLSFLFLQLMRKEKQSSQEGTLKQNQDLFIAGPLMGGDLVATELAPHCRCSSASSTSLRQHSFYV